jgi:hypothetical protein
MEQFVHQQNLLLLRKQLATTQTQAQRLQLSSLLAEEEARAMRSPGSSARKAARRRAINHGFSRS